MKFYPNSFNGFQLIESKHFEQHAYVHVNKINMKKNMNESKNAYSVLHPTNSQNVSLIPQIYLIQFDQ